MSHFSAIGFHVETEDDYRRLVIQSLEHGSQIRTKGGEYCVWSPGSGAELWTMLNLNREIMAANPHFMGKGRMPVRDPKLMRNENYPLEGKLHVWAVVLPGDETGAEYPFMVDLPDFELTESAIGNSDSFMLQIGAFAHQIKYFMDEAEYDLIEGERKMALESSIPVGLFQDENFPEPSSYVLYTGRVLEGERRINPVTQKPFYYALLKTLCGTIDVVADINDLPAPPAAGGIIQGIFWLSARFADETDR